MTTEEEKTLAGEVASGGYDAKDRPFDFVDEESETALICERDAVLRERIAAALKAQGYRSTAPLSAKDALKAMRFHVFDVVVLNECFDTNDPQTNEVLRSLENMTMTTRRRFFVALVGEGFRTMDNMAAFNRSVNLVINLKDLDEVGKIVKQGVADHKAFYHVFQESLQKMGKL